MNSTSIPSDAAVLEQLERILSSQLFAAAARSRALLKFVVEHSLEHPGESLKEYTLGSEALERGDSFDPRTDPIVRAEASRLRSRLERYYLSEGAADPVEITLPKGGYSPQFSFRIAPVQPTVSAPPFRSSPAGWLAIGALLGGITTWTAIRQVRPQAPPSPLIQFEVELKSKGILGSEVGRDAVITPDGTRIAYVSLGEDGISHLNTRRLDQSNPVELPGTEEARGPFFSPEGRWIGFWSEGKLKKIPVDEGSPVTLCDAIDNLGASWSEDGNIYASLRGFTLVKIPASGGQPVVVLDLSKESASPLWPQILRDRNTVIFTAVGPKGPNQANIEAVSLSTGKRIVLARNGTFGRYLPNGFLTYINQGTLYAQRFDADRVQTSGPAVPVLQGISYSSMFGFAQIDFSLAGTVVYEKTKGEESVATWLDETGNTEPFLAKPGHYLSPTLSPDGSRIALGLTESGTSSVLIYDQPSGHTTRIATAGRVTVPIWTPDGRSLILGGLTGLSWIPSNGEGQPRSLLPSKTPTIPWSFSPNGKRLAYHQLSEKTAFDLWTVPVEESNNAIKVGEPAPFLAHSSYETYPAFSPDGNWIAYGSNESRSWELYVRHFPDDGKVTQVSTRGGRIARWSKNGHELFYRTDDQRIMVAEYTTKSGSFVVKSVRRWSPRRLAETGVVSNFDLSPDGKRVLALMPAARPENRQEDNHVTILQNFFDEIQRRVASAK